MKKFLITAVLTGLIAGVAFADSNVVSSANIVGYSQTDIESGGNFYLMAANFETGETNTLQSVFGTDMLTQDDNYINCDRVFLYNSDTQTYQAWAQWTDGTFYKANDLTDWNSFTAGNPEIPVGTGFFVSSSAASSNTLTFSGDVVMSTTNPVEIVEGFQILGFPYSADQAIQDTTLFADGATYDDNYINCDRIHVYNAGVYQAYAIWSDGQWYQANDLTDWNSFTPATNDIDLSEGFFYEAKTNMTWSQTNIYPNVGE